MMIKACRLTGRGIPCRPAAMEPSKQDPGAQAFY